MNNKEREILKQAAKARFEIPELKVATAEMAISPEDKIKHGLEYDKWLEAKINKTNIYSYKAKKNK